MTELYASLAGHRVTRARIYVPQIGPWFADCDFDEAPQLSGKVDLTVAKLTLLGTFAASYSGSFVLQGRIRIVGGGGGWGREIGPKAYHNDARVKARTIAEDAAREAGETLGEFAPPEATVGADFVRRTGPASRAIESVLGGVPWWVGYDGVTRAGERAASTPAASAYEIVDYDPRSRVVTFSADDLSLVGIGSVLSGRLDAPQTIRELEIELSPEGLRVKAWCGGDEKSRARLPDLLEKIARKSTDGQIWGVWRYRVIGMAGDRVQLQAMSKAAGLPDIVYVPMRPGLSGAFSELAPSCEVLVQFVEGSSTMPVIVGFGEKEGPGWVPQKTTLRATDEIALQANAVKLGSPSASKGVALLGDTVTFMLPPANFSGQINGMPAAGFVVWPLSQTTGQITTSSNKVFGE